MSTPITIPRPAPGEPAGAVPGGAAPQATPDRATRFLARVDAHLATVANPRSRRRFLEEQIAAWERAYARFLQEEEDAPPAAADARAASDYLLTITGLAARLVALREGAP